ncbi:MAG TPA: DUF2760 domain-containing protein [Verrucomicrobiae bacterium]|nr:DUF2760 domain-containing protein [Verrucomicrobiae bacterium]
MERNGSPQGMSFFARLALALRLVFDAGTARKVTQGLQALETVKQPEPPERLHASGLMLLSGLQREGRLVDFLQQDIAGFSDEEVGSAARVVHGGCQKVLRQYFDFDPAAKEPEGTMITVPAGFDAQRIRLTGKVAGQPPFKGTLKHHGWVAKAIRMPVLSESMDPRVVAPAEVELS